jgi:hypothetical protein
MYGTSQRTRSASVTKKKSLRDIINVRKTLCKVSSYFCGILTNGRRRRKILVKLQFITLYENLFGDSITDRSAPIYGVADRPT